LSGLSGNCWPRGDGWRGWFAIYEDVPLSVRCALHREAGQRLAGGHAPVLQVAEHLARGAGAGDAEAIAWLTRTARQAATTSPDVAANLMGRAIGLMDPADPSRDSMLVEQDPRYSLKLS
jgi:hypothetical protein